MIIDTQQLDYVVDLRERIAEFDYDHSTYKETLDMKDYGDIGDEDLKDIYREFANGVIGVILTWSMSDRDDVFKLLVWIKEYWYEYDTDKLGFELFDEPQVIQRGYQMDTVRLIKWVEEGLYE